MSKAIQVKSYACENHDRSCPGLDSLPDELENDSDKENRPKSQKYDRVHV